MKSKPKRKAASSGESRWATSIQQAAAQSGFPEAALKAAKRKGCPAFRNGRVCLPELREWLEEHGDELKEAADKDALECRRLLAQCKGLERKNDVEAGLYIPIDTVRADLLRIGSATRAAFSRVRAEAPTWEGLTAAQIEQRAIALEDSVCADLHDATSKLYA